MGKRKPSLLEGSGPRQPEGLEGYPSGGKCPAKCPVRFAFSITSAVYHAVNLDTMSRAIACALRLVNPWFSIKSRVAISSTTARATCGSVGGGPVPPAWAARNVAKNA